MTIAHRIALILAGDRSAMFARGGGGGGAKSSKSGKGKAGKEKAAKKAKGGQSASSGGACCKVEGGKFGPGNNYGSLNRGSAKVAANKAGRAAGKAVAKAAGPARAGIAGMIGRSRQAAAKGGQQKAARDREQAVQAKKAERSQKARERRAAKKAEAATARARPIGRMVAKSKAATAKAASGKAGRTTAGNVAARVAAAKAAQQAQVARTAGQGKASEADRAALAKVRAENAAKRAGAKKPADTRSQAERWRAAGIQPHSLGTGKGTFHPAGAMPKPLTSKASGRHTPEREMKAGRIRAERKAAAEKRARATGTATAAVPPAKPSRGGTREERAGRLEGKIKARNERLTERIVGAHSEIAKMPKEEQKGSSGDQMRAYQRRLATRREANERRLKAIETAKAARGKAPAAASAAASAAGRSKAVNKQMNTPDVRQTAKQVEKARAKLAGAKAAGDVGRKASVVSVLERERAAAAAKVAALKKGLARLSPIERQGFTRDLDAARAGAGPPVKPPPAAIERRPISDPARLHAESSKMDEAFNKAPGRKDNFVKISDLQASMPHLSRDEFVAVLNAGRRAGKYTLDSHEGLHGKASDAMKAAAIHEHGSRLVYVSLRNDAPASKTGGIGGREPDLRGVAPAGKTPASSRAIAGRATAISAMVRKSREAAQGKKLVASKRAKKKRRAAS